MTNTFTTAPLDDLIANAVRSQFASRPTLLSVSAKLLTEGIKEAYPNLLFNIVTTKLGIPNSLGGWDLRLLINVALDHVGNGTSPDFSARDGQEYFLTNRAPARLVPVGVGSAVLDMRVIERVIREIPAILAIGFQQALSAYWEQSTGAGPSRWQWLSELLKTNMISTAVALPATEQARRDLLKQVTEYPDRLDRVAACGPDAARVYVIETTMTVATRTFSVLSPDLLVVNASMTLLCHVSGRDDYFVSQDAFDQHWEQKINREFVAEQIAWKRFEPNGNVFDVQAAIVLNQQLDDLAAIELPFNQGTHELEQRYDRVTDPAPLFLDVVPVLRIAPERLLSSVPAWLKDASAIDRMAYRRHLLTLASAKEQAKGRSFLDGIDDIRTFASKALHAQMLLDQPAAPGYKPDELELTFAVAAGYPGGAGFIQPVTMSLTDLALKNLAGKPKGAMTIRHKGEQLIQAWTTPDYLTDLVSRVNIGQVYPEHLKSLLLTDTAEARQREQLFSQQLRAQLPLQALELAIKGLAGFTAQGHTCVAALMQPSRAERIIDGQPIVIRSLAFLRKSGAQADVVTNMFVIEPLDSRQGPHLLYRPFYQESLQDSVLTWLADTARPVYANGGFTEPHIIRFGQGSEFDVLQKPAPATLAGDEGSGELLQSQSNGQLPRYLFGAHARALVALADRESISNAESRWEVLLEGGGLLLNTLLLPLLQGSVMSIAWLLMMTQSLARDVPALESNDPQTRELAWVDLLLSLSLLLLHATQRGDTLRQPVVAADLASTTLALAPLRRTSASAPAKALLNPAAIALPDALLAQGRTVFDFAFSNALNRLSTSQRAYVESFKVARPAELPAPIETGTRQGLYRIDNRLHALIDGELYPVASDLDAVFIIDPDDKSRTGPSLKTDDNGQWTMDLGLKLRGGAPGQKMKNQQKINRQAQARMQAERDRLEPQVSRLVTELSQAMGPMRTARDEYYNARTRLRNWWTLLATNTDERKVTFLQKQHQDEQIKCAAAKQQLNSLLQVFEQQAHTVINARRELINAVKPALKAQDTSEFEKYRSTEFDGITAMKVFLNDQTLKLAMDSGYTPDGETILEIIQRLDQQTLTNTPEGYNEFIACVEHMTEYEEKILQNLYALDATLQEQALDSAHGKSKSQAFIRSLPTQEMADPFNTLLNNLNLLRELSVDKLKLTDAPEALYFSQLIGGQNLRMAATSHIALRTYSHFTASERKAVLITLISRYASVERASRSLQELDLGLNRPIFHERFIDRLGQARRSAQADLATLIRDEEGIAIEGAAPKTKEPRTSSKRVFKTRNQGTLIGDIRAVQPNEPVNIIEVRDPFTQKTLASFVEHRDEGVWNELVTARPGAPAPVPVQRSLNSLKGVARQLIQQKAGIVSSIRFQMRKLQDATQLELVDPLDWNDMLIKHAEKLSAVATELEQAHGSKAEVAALVADYRRQASEMTTEAKHYCSIGYKAQRPTQEHVDYLWTHRTVDINLAHRRQPTAAGDYVAEYVIREKNTPDALWYAHFHYAEADSPANAYSVGHLKLADQRYLLQKDLVREAGANDGAVVDVVYAPITAPLDQKLFLRL